MAGAIAAGVSALTDLFGETWEDRIKEAAYTSPGGTRIRFYFEDVSRATDKRTAAFEFFNVPNAYVQDNGHGSRRYPLICFFWGDTHDLEATAFENALLETGVGKLEHPFYGTFDVVPFGTITRRDDLRSAANQSVVEVVFWTTTGVVYPQAEGVPGTEISAAIEGFDVAAAQAFANDIDDSTLANLLALKGTIRGHLREVNAALAQVASGVSSVEREFRDLERTLNFGIDVLIRNPLLLAQRCIELINTPSKIFENIAARLAGYADLAQRIVSTDAADPEKALSIGSALSSRRAKINNDFEASDLFVLSAVSGSVSSSINAQFASKPEALVAAEQVQAQLDFAVAWRDDAATALEFPDTGEAYQALQQAAALAVGRLVEVSFTLVPELRIVLDRPRTIIDLAAQLYGEVDARLDTLIATNDLTGSEILELPRGREIVYYP